MHSFLPAFLLLFSVFRIAGMRIKLYYLSVIINYLSPDKTLSKRDNTLSKSDNTLSHLDNTQTYVFRKCAIRIKIKQDAHKLNTECVYEHRILTIRML